MKGRHQERIQEPRNIRQALFGALEDTNITAQSISKVSGVGNSLISNFKTSGSFNCKNLQKVIDSLPEEVFERFIELLQNYKRENDTPKVSDNQIVLELRQIAQQYAANRKREANEREARSRKK